MNKDLLYAGLSAMTGTELIHPSHPAARNIRSAPISIDHVFEYTYNPVRPTLRLHLQHPPSEWVHVNVKTVIGAVTIFVKKNDTIAQVKEAIKKENKSLSADRQKLFFKKRQLSDTEKVQSIGIEDGDTIEDISEIHNKHKWKHVSVKTAIGIVIELYIHIDYTIATVKYEIEKLNKSLPADNQRLIFNKRRLSDEETVESIGIENEDTLFLMMILRGGGPGDDGLPIVLHDGFLDPSYNYDFTRQHDDGKVYKRGGEVYKRPYGWYRFAIKVLNKYGDNIWLGGGGIRTESTAGEWPVSYHGTTGGGAEGITKTGYDEKYSKRQKYGKGIYSTPHLSIAESYATQFRKDGKNYKIVLQNRVNPAKFCKANEDKYWIVDDSNIRPYGILVKES